MDAIIVRVARAIASYPRLRILSYLTRHGETIPTVLAEKLDMALPSLSVHVKVLSLAGLVIGRKSGAKCYYSIDSPYGPQTLSGQISQWLSSVLTKVRGTAKHDDESVHTLVFGAATAFTDLRRLAILRRLLTRGPATADELSGELSMSLYAVRRHTEKLHRRGYIMHGRTADGSLGFAIAATGNSAIHTRLFRIVRRTWQPG